MAGLKITVVAVGKLKERFWKDAVAEYAKRLGGYCQLKLVEVADRDPAKCGGDAKAMEAEGADILRALPEGAGGGYVAKKYPERVRLLPVRDKQELVDVDTRETLRELLER